MSCLHGNPIGGCDICDEIDAAFEAGRRSGLAEQPANKPWVGLTDEEVKKEVEVEMEYYWDGDYIDSACACEQLNNFVRTIEAKLKEKNH